MGSESKNRVYLEKEIEKMKRKHARESKEENIKMVRLMEKINKMEEEYI